MTTHKAYEGLVTPTAAETAAGLLPPADLKIIEAEHARLDAFLRDLRETCVWFDTTDTCLQCDRERHACCLGRLSSFQFEFVELMEEHIANEERLMMAALGAEDQDHYLFQHRAAHQQVSVEVRRLLQECAAMDRQGQIAAAIRLLHARIHTLFSEHARQYDRHLFGSSHRRAGSQE